MSFCKERKSLLSGGEVTYDCELIGLQEGFGLLRHLIGRQYEVGSLTLIPGMVSYGFYWTGKPYTLYLWLQGNGGRVGYYFNLADSISLSPKEFKWRDLAVDVLILPWGEVEILDEDQLPSNLPGDLRSYIESAKGMVLKNYGAIIEEANNMLVKWV